MTENLGSNKATLGFKKNTDGSLTLWEIGSQMFVCVFNKYGNGAEPICNL